MKTGRPKAICGQRYLLPCFAWLWIAVRGSRAAAPKGTKSCRTLGDFSLFVRPSVCPSIHPPRPSQACDLPSQAWQGRLQAWEDRFQAWVGIFKAWESRFHAWAGRFQAWEGRFQAWESPGGDEQMDGRTDRRTDKPTNEWTNQQKSPCVQQNFVPFGAAAQKEE